MDVTELIDALSRPTAYPHPVDRVDVVQTHISAVFLAGDFAYKVKKPVNLGFLDFTTLAKRQHYCREEVRLNSRAAPGVYLDVVEVKISADRVAIGGPGKTIEYAVRMRRLDPARTLAALLAANDLDGDTVAALGRRVADFHAGAYAGPELARWGALETVAFNVRENFEQLSPYVGRSVSRPVYDALASLSEAALAARGPLIEARAARGMTRDTHGDLHLAHVYSFPAALPPADFVIVDCIEFNERFRYADPIADLAFLVMDLKLRGRPDLAGRLADAYFAGGGDNEGRALLPFYTAYRAVVRGKVESFVLDQATVPADARRAALERARAELMLALGELAPPRRRPCLVLVVGLPGTGKTVVARGVAAAADMVHVSTDATRKVLAGVPPDRLGTTRLGAERYTPEWTERTYRACLEKAAELLLEGRRVIVDGNFRDSRWRSAALDLAARLAVGCHLFVCEASAGTIRERLGRRATGASDPADASDADFSVYEKVAPEWQPLSAEESARATVVSTEGSPTSGVESVLEVLTSSGLA